MRIKQVSAGGRNRGEMGIERRRQTELLIVHVATLGGRHLPVRRLGRGRLLGLATVEHDSSEDPTQSGRVDRRVVMQRVEFWPRCSDAKRRGWAEEGRDWRARDDNRPRFIKLLGWDRSGCRCRCLSAREACAHCAGVPVTVLEA